MNAKCFEAVWAGTFKRVNGQVIVYTIELKGTLEAISTGLNYFISRKRGLKYLFGEFQELKEVTQP